MMNRIKQSLPDHIIFGILGRLPGKSLARFKCVCKLWYAFLSQLKFHTDDKVILSSDFLVQPVNFEASSSTIKAVQLDFPLKVRSGFKVIGSCNGLLLVIYDEGFVMWNTWTGGYERLSSLYNPAENYLDVKSYIEYYFGFGYDHSTDD
ncbi:hypothetical protein JRO89_XS03G0079900 [Xanthoceras sorbifolium]|uniref:F-box domain-containing protein n=1 Tax=Xanthoceras sorbifolium TaxID=99658 RepID=A0ABQ8I936_9ROSI|nr:hypothetical protein JRO89_XS03G0079900 [Xanthoceras sorbifolium]